MIFSPEEVTKRKLQTLPLEQLRSLCRSLGLSDKHKSADLIIRTDYAKLGEQFFDR